MKIDGVRVVQISRLRLDEKGVGWVRLNRYEERLAIPYESVAERLGIGPLPEVVEIYGKEADRRIAEYNKARGPQPSYKADAPDEYRAQLKAWRERDPRILLQADHDRTQRALSDWLRRAAVAPAYQKIVAAFIAAQETEPTQFRPNAFGQVLWAYRRGVFELSGDYLASIDFEQAKIIIQHYAVNRDQQFKRAQRELKAFENISARMAAREPIPFEMQLLIWRRDEARCVECQSKTDLEFDHIIPVSQGGATSEANLQLLCRRCNRTKGNRV